WPPAVFGLASPPRSAQAALGEFRVPSGSWRRTLLQKTSGWCHDLPRAEGAASRPAVHDPPQRSQSAPLPNFRGVTFCGEFLMRSFAATAGAAMARGCSRDLRVRALAIVEARESAREAARLLKVGASTAIRWVQRWTTTGSIDAKPGTRHRRFTTSPDLLPNAARHLRGTSSGWSI